MGKTEMVKKTPTERRPRTITRHNIALLEREMGKITPQSLLKANFTPIVHAYLYKDLETKPSDTEIKRGRRSDRPHLMSLKPMGLRALSWANGRHSMDMDGVTINQQTFDFKYLYNYTEITERTSYGNAGLAIGILTGHPVLGAFIGSTSGVTTYTSENHEVHIHTPGLILESKDSPPIGIVPVPKRYGPLDKDSWRHFDTWEFPDYDRGLVVDYDRKPEKADFAYRDLLFSVFVLAKDQGMPINLVSDWLNVANTIL